MPRPKRAKVASGASPSHGPSALKIQSTPMQEASILALKNFKRRTRQPSILRTARLSVQSATQFDLGDDLDDFDPDDESTPLHLGRLNADDATTFNGNKSSSSRKRKLSSPTADLHVPHSSPPLHPQLDSAVELMKDTIDLSRNLSSSPAASEPDLPEYVPETVHNTQDNESRRWSDTMAPPKSSSSSHEREEHDSEEPHVLAKKTAKGVESSKKQALSASKPTRATRSKATQAKGLSTADLQSLMPQRRSRQVSSAKPDTFEIPSDSDELSGAEEVSASESMRLARSVNQTKKPMTRQTRTPLQSIARSNNSRNAARPSRGPSRLSEGKPSGAARKKTYGRQNEMLDKENQESFFEPDEEDSVEAGVVVGNDGKNKPRGGLTSKQSEELKAIKQKFADVDDWEMDFESVEVGGETSSWR